jgi:hypothetical protein
MINHLTGGPPATLSWGTDWILSQTRLSVSREVPTDATAVTYVSVTAGD